MGNANGRLIAARSFASLTLMSFLFAPFGFLNAKPASKNTPQDLAAAASIGKIAFASDRDGNLEIYTMEADGGAQTRLTENTAEDYQPAWSPDGTRLAFVTNRDGNPEIYVMNSDGSGQTRLTNNAAGDIRPVWTPDGARIGFVSDRDGNDEIYLMNADGSNQTNLTSNKADDSSFSFSPDGSAVVFSSTREDSSYDLFTMSIAGGGATRLTTAAGDDIDPAWSPAQISFQSNRDGNDEIYITDFGGQNQTRLSTNTDFDEDPAPTANGSRIVFSTSRDGNFELYAMVADGTRLLRLTTNSASDIQPAVQAHAAIPLPPAAGAALIQFTATDFTANEGDGFATLTVGRSGSTAAAATVDFATINGTATNVGDYSANFGTLKFNAGEASKTFRVLLTDDGYQESDEKLGVTLSNPTGGALGGLNTATVTIVENDTAALPVNPIDNARFFITQHYSDFLSRSPDQAGLDYWTGQITLCGNNLACLVARRNAVSAAFFVETEFQDSGFFVYRLYKGSLGVQPTYQQFIRDRARVVGGTTLQADKLALANDFVTRDAFVARYPAGQTPTQFVNLLFDTAGLVPFTAERQKLITDVTNGKTRAQAVIEVIEIAQFKSREFNLAFVLMQYFGYLRRDIDPTGYAFWLDVITNRQPNNYSGMVCAFITSAEYQQRFSATVTANNGQCPPVP